MGILGRIPVIALDYNDIDKAKPKELVIDYDNGNIYVVSATDKSVIFDITAQIKNQLDNISSANIEVDVSGVGIINLQDLMNQMKTDVDSSVKCIPTKEPISYIGKENVLDDHSLDIYNHEIEVKGFKIADDFSMPRKRNGVLEWVPMLDVLYKDNTIDPSDSGEIISPGTPDDGSKLKCALIEPNDGVLYLRSSRRQKSLFVHKDCKVVLPTTVDEYAEIQWMYITDDILSEFSYSPNIFWDKKPCQIVNTIHIITFKTWDNGNIWAATMNVFNTNYDGEYVTRAMVKSEYYSKDEVDDMLEIQVM